MNLQYLLGERKQAIVEAWFRDIIATYPKDSRKYIGRQNDQFGNPVGHTLGKDIEGIFNELLKGPDDEKVNAYLENIIKVRAIQDFDAAEAVGFVFLLKSSVRDVLKKELKDQKTLAEFIDFQEQVDRLALSAFKIYMATRERLYELRTREVTRRTERLLQRIGAFYTPPERQSNDDT